MCITKPRELSIPLERFVLQICVRYQVIALKALQLFQAWSEDEQLPYQL